MEHAQIRTKTSKKQSMFMELSHNFCKIVSGHVGA